MVWEGVPWFVDGGEHGPEVARVLAYASAGGREGVIGVEDLKVTASPIPDGNVHVSPGAAAVRSQFAGASSQAYIVRNVGDEVRALAPQGSSGIRYDYVAVLVQDPQYAGQPAPASIEDGPYVVTTVYQNAGPNIRSLAELDADQSGLLLARVKFDTSDGTITASDITDLRNTLFARSQTEERIVSISSGVTNMPGSWGLHPPGAQWEIEVPEWATRVNLSAMISGIDALDNGADGGTATGAFRVRLGPILTDSANWRANAVGPGKQTTMATQAAQGNIDCRAIAGTRQILAIDGIKNGGSGMVMRSMDGTNAVARAVFMEKAV